MTMPEIFKRRRPAWIGFLIAPLVPWVVLEIIGVLSTGQGPEIFAGVFLLLPVAYLTSLVIGAPAVWILRHFKLNGVFPYALAGLLTSMVPIFVTLVYPFIISFDPTSPAADAPVASHYGIAVLMILCGVIVATSFWVITRPDKGATS